ncbi:amino acid adenylation domain-containing protein [Rhodococcus sp. NM-2]|uniref:amino acid adenylation domain-containing protein n=1 Tax=Rhodococcus sp. NM-2 TaxID=3401174 RepID=UPI003AAC41E7
MAIEQPGVPGNGRPEPVPADGAFDLSSAQSGLYFAQQLAPEAPVTIAQFVDLEGPLDVCLLEKVSKQAGRELGSAYLRIAVVESHPVQYVDPTSDDSLIIVDLRDHPNPALAAKRWMRNETQRVVDPQRDRLVLAAVLKVTNRRHFWYCRIHHIALDGFGAMTLTTRIADLYTAAIEEVPPPPFAAGGLKDVHAASETYSKSARFERDRKFWAERLRTLPSVTNLAGRTARASPDLHSVSATMKTRTAAALARSADRYDVSIAAVVLAGVAGYLARSTGRRDVVVSMPVSGRTSALLKRSGGTISNVLPIRVKVDPGTSVGDLARTVHLEMTGALKHQKYRYEDMRRESGAVHGARGFLGPLVNMMLFHTGISLGSARGTLRVLSTGPIEDMSINFYQASTDEEIQVDFVANSALYTEPEVRRHQQQFMRFFEELCSAGSHTRIADVDAAAAEEWLMRLSSDDRREREALSVGETHGGLDLPRLGAPASHGHVQARIVISGAVRSRLESLAQQHNTSLFLVVHTAFVGLLTRITRTADLTVVVPVAGRSEEGDDGFVGMFVSAVALSTSVDPTTTLSDLLVQVSARAAVAFEHAGDSYGRVANAPDEQDSSGRFAAMSAAQQPIDCHPDFPSLMISTPDHLAPGGTPAISLTLGEGAAGFGAVDIDGTLQITDSSAETADALARWLVRLLDAMATDPTQILHRFDLLEPEERRALTQPPGSARMTGTLIDVFLARVADDPDSVAVVHETARMTYRELDEASNRLARLLISRGTGPEDLVAVALPRSMDLIVSLLAVLKAGAAYLPLDVRYPRDRLEYILADAGPRCVLANAAGLEALETTGSALIMLDADDIAVELSSRPSGPIAPHERVRALRSDNVAYVIYTSGSTGRPKGVSVPHINVLRLFDSVAARFEFGPRDVWTMFHSAAFDFSVWELWGALLHGGTLIVVDYYVSRSPDEFLSLIRREGVTVLNQTPSAFYQLIEAERRSTPEALPLRYVIFGGEALDFRRLPEWYRRHGNASPALVNMYGITETTVHVSYLAIDDALVQRNSGNLVGDAIDGLAVYVLDEYLQPVPVGMAGEMYVGGGQVSRGYLRRPGLSASRFVANRFGAAGSRLYRSGDRARWVAPGMLEYLGRDDDQVKVRGFRIELGEIDAAVMTVTGVGQSITVVTEDVRGDEQLTTYLTCTSGGPIDVVEVRRLVGALLPDYMVPDGFVVLDAIPLTTNGKLDRRALPAPEVAASGESGRAPAGEHEKLVAALVGEVLDLPKVGVEDSFFHLGGNSLVAAQMVGRLSEATGLQIPLRVLFENPTVGALASWIAVTGVSGSGTDRAVTALAPRPRSGSIPLAPAQQRLWFLARLDSTSGAYNIPLAVRLRGELDVDALNAAMLDVVARHETLRTVHPQVGDDPCQVLVPAADAAPPLVPVIVTADDLEARIHAIAAAGFDLLEELPLRAALLRIGSDDHLLVLVLHHIAVDGWSLQPLAADITAAYSARSAGIHPHRDPLPVQYADYALWQHEMLGAETDPNSLASAQIAYWTERLAGIPDQTDLPVDRPRSAGTTTMRGATVDFIVDPQTHQALAVVAADRGATVFMALHAALIVLLARFGGGTDIAVGTPVAGRGDRVLDGLVGMFVNTVVLRTEMDASAGFVDLLEQVRDIDLEAFCHADLPFERLVDVLDIPRSASRHPLFQVALTSRIVDQYTIEFPDLTMTVSGIDTGLTKFDLELAYAETFDDAGAPAGIELTFTFATELFDAPTVDAMAATLVRVLRAAVATPRMPVGDIDILDEDSVQRLVPARGTEAIEVRTLPALLRAAAQLKPDAPALLSSRRSMTYRELDERSDRLAGLLVERGVGPETFVALALERSIESVLTVWAVTKTGAAYVPVDPHYPAERLAHMLSDSGVRLGITTSATRTLPGVVHWIALDDPDIEHALDSRQDTGGPRPRLRPDNAAYVIYTSGSTGVPKGTVVTHSGFANFAREQQRRYSITPQSRTLHFASPSFDGAVLELLLAGATGATMVIAPAGVFGGAELAEVLRTRRVTHAFITPAALATVDPAGMDHLESLVVGGDVCSPELVQRWAPGRRMFNGYGPTEATIMVCISDALTVGGPITIGRPVRGVRAVVLDARLHPVPAGVTGELYISGPGLARGYHRLGGLTSERFVADPFGEPGDRMYRTGDVVKWTPQHTIRYVGRSDHQVKIRGFRIELGEIDAVLASHPLVEFVTTIGDDSTGRTLLASYVLPTAGAEVTPGDLVQYAATRLPGYMVPAVMLLDDIPLTPVGKLDRRALPTPVLGTSATIWQAPSTPTERLVAEVYAGVLGVADVGADDSFFDLGGNSLAATQVTGRLQSVLECPVEVRAIFEAPTVAGLARRIDGESSDIAAPPVPTGPQLVARRSHARVPLSAAQQRLWFLNRLDPESAAYNIPFAIRMCGSLDRLALTAALADVVERHESLRTVYPETPEGPEQLVLDSAEPVMSVADATESELAGLINEMASDGFDLRTDRPLRTLLYRTAPEVHILALIVHHIAFDGWSLAPFARDLVVAYAARVEGTAPAWSPLAVQYADYTLWQLDLLGAGDDPHSVRAKELAYWKDTLAGLPDQLALPGARLRPAVQDLAGDSVSFAIDPDTHRHLDDLARESGATLFMALHATLAVLLARMTGDSDIAIGTPVAGRGDQALDQLVGMFVNTLVLRTSVDSAQEFTTLLTQVRETDLDAFAHARVPFEQIVQAVNPSRSTGGHPLFQVMLSFHQNPAPTAMSLPGLDVTAESVDPGVAKFDLEFTLIADVAADGGHRGIAGSLGYASALFDARTVRSFAEYFVRIVEEVATRPSSTLGDLRLVSAADQAAWLPVAGAPRHEPRTLAEIFENSAAHRPDSTAVECGDQLLTYRELDEQSNRLARVLLDRGIGPEHLVAVALPRSVNSVLAVWAVAKTGAAFVPVDPNYPADRVRHMLDDSGAAAGITLAGHLGTLPADLDWIVLDSPASRQRYASASTALITPVERGTLARTDQLAYVIYTSGSTGKPKGVAITHRGLAGFGAEQRERYRVTPSSRTLHFSSPSFDASVLELLLAFDVGATMVISPPHIYGGEELAELIRRERVTHAFVTPAALASVSPDGLDELGVVVVGGELCPPELVARWAPARAMFNGYGPTETTIMGCISDPLTVGEAITIGGPVRGVGAMVLDPRLHPVPVGVIGELYLTGDGIARGYHGHPGRTAERFVAARGHETGARMYRTGDLVRWQLSDDETATPKLEYVGRVDQQVKIRGFRIELGEIDSVLRAHPDVDFATTQGHTAPSGETVLVSYVLPAAHRQVDPASLREFAASSLPTFMVPASVTVLDALPLTPVGKLDLRALPEPTIDTPRGEFVPLATETERRVAAVFAELLGIDAVGAATSFFDLGGNSLLATQVVSRVGAGVGKQIGVRELFEAPTVRGFAATVDGITTAMATRPSLQRTPDLDAVPLSFAQERIWILNQMDVSSPAYNIPFALTLRGTLDVHAIEAAFADLLERHESLRTLFPDSESGPIQVVLDTELVAPRLTPVPVAANELDERVHAVTAGFDVTTETPLRAELLAHGQNHWTLVITVHHIAADGWSITPLVRDVMTAYAARTAGDAPPWVPLPVQYADYAVWQRQLLGSSRDQTILASTQLEFWRRELADLPDHVELPIDRPRPVSPSFRGAAVEFSVSARTRASLTELARTNDSSLFMIVHAAFAALLARVTASRDVAIGTPVAGRGERELDDLVGMFVNTLVLRSRIDPRTPFRDLLRQVRETDLRAYAHADLPFERLVDDLDPIRSTARHPLFQVMLSFHASTPTALELAGLDVQARELDGHIAKFDLQLTIRELPGDSAGLMATFTYATELFDSATVEALADRLTAILDTVADDPTAIIGDIDLLVRGERDRTVPISGARGVPVRTLPEIFETTAAAAGDTPAIVDVAAVGSLTYRELDERSNRMARLLTELGVGPETFVALAIPRSVDFVVAVWAVTKAGGAFLPIDPSYPVERIEHMLADSGALLGLTVAEHRDRLPDLASWTVLDDQDVAPVLADKSGSPLAESDRRAPLAARHPAYVIYTSGSTGRPKGVVTTHEGVANFAAELRERFTVTAESRTLQFASPSFDASVLEQLLAFGAGATIVLAPGSVYGGDDLAELLHQYQVTHAFVTPAALASVDPTGLDCVHTVVVGGDTCSTEIVERWAPGRRIFNAYGPTEATVAVTISDALHAGQPVTIGGPIRGVEALILDERLHPVPEGVRGELYVAGPGLARGYVGNAAQTADRFVANPFGGRGARMYRTGDVVRRRAGSGIEYLGRSDQQVKVRGFRIELGEIDTALTSHPQVRFAVTVVHGDSEPAARLVSYVVADGADSTDSTDSASLQAHVAAKVPGYMVPSAVTFLDDIPLTSAGKLDRAALPKPEFPNTAQPRLPQTQTESTICAVFARVLEIQSVGADENFFDLGGNSLLGTRLVAALRSELDVEVAVPWLFTNPTPELLARRIEHPDSGGPTALDESALAVLLPIRIAGSQLPLFCIHPAIGLSWCYGGLAQHLDSDRPIFGLQSPALTETPAESPSIEALAVRYAREIRAVQPDGPYHLLGWSLGGLIAHAVAVEIQRNGHEVALLAMMDSYVLSDSDTVGADPTPAELLREFGIEVPVGDGGVDGFTAEDAAVVLRDAASPFGYLTPAQLERLYEDYLRAHERAHEYRPATYSGQLLFFSARVDNFELTRTASAWRPYVTGTITDYPVEYPHAHMTTSDALASIGPILEERLETAAMELILS